LQQAKRELSDLNAIAYTSGPGLAGALLVGATFAKSLSFALNIPSLAVHHMEGHLLAALLEEPRPTYPFLALLVSGGHTLIAAVRDLQKYEILGESLDDAAGEAFDKTAKLLGLPYPGGPHLAKLAESGSDKRFIFPRPMIKKANLHFSFSGLKTHAINTFNKTTQSFQDKADIACAFQTAVIDTLFIKCQRALQQTDFKQLVIAGGVSANQCLRQTFIKLEKNSGIKLFYPKVEFCTDNGAMIAFAGHEYFKKNISDADLAIAIRPRWPLDSL